MRGTSLAPDNSPIARSAPARAQSKMQERRRALIIIGGILFVAGLGVMLVIATEFMILPPNSYHAASAGPDNNLRTARVTIDSVDGNGCQQQVLDNQTWRMTRTQQPCDPTARDSNGVPIPLGTIHRLGAISKSFSGK